MLSYLSGINKKNHSIPFFLVSFLALLIDFFCWNLELKSCFYIVNVVQVIYSLTIIKQYGIQNNAEITGTKTALLSVGELLLTAGIIFVASMFRSGLVLTFFIIFLLALLLTSMVVIFLKTTNTPPVFLIANLFGFVSMLIVLRSNMNILSPTYAASMQQMLLSCGITYLVSVLLTISTTAIYKLKEND